jgi:hydroxymethylglutaryl-CoA lyase
MMATNAVDLVEVGPRNGYQGIKPLIPTIAKIALLKRLVAPV